MTRGETTGAVEGLVEALRAAEGVISHLVSPVPPGGSRPLTELLFDIRRALSAWAQRRQMHNDVDLVAHITVNVVPNVSLPDVRAVLEAVENWRSSPPSSAAPPQDAYPCDHCGRHRSKDQGGAMFTVCDECWDQRALDPLGIAAPADDDDVETPEEEAERRAAFGRTGPCPPLVDLARAAQPETAATGEAKCGTCGGRGEVQFIKAGMWTLCPTCRGTGLQPPEGG